MIRRQKQYANNSIYRNSFSQRLKQEDCGARAMAQQLGTLVTLSEDPGLVPSTNPILTPFLRDLNPPLNCNNTRHTCGHIHTCRQDTQKNLCFNNATRVLQNHRMSGNSGHHALKFWFTISKCSLNVLILVNSSERDYIHIIFWTCMIRTILFYLFFSNCLLYLNYILNNIIVIIYMSKQYYKIQYWFQTATQSLRTHPILV